ncbi:PQQ-binding-like beta-propeller repeat protein [Saccharibacillus sp. JS10]|uniref:outer membrane protein assembly factor BamB family protein n=1 Tax=Saccharibacillus sp. JS10 TaxID=2950552 RepID=UPI00210E835C|nr:PQQ-binding-like beta-propeller repeat protein [Saccharibacillus sp. JS10]MCQ4088207.1 PQQ-binding-like beta-propeller repeat protein [Saccharibacillus sp. JS10]
MKSTEKWGAFVLSAAVLLSAPGYAGASTGSLSGSKLPQPSWTSSSVYDTSLASAHDVRFVASRNLVYAHTVQHVQKSLSPIKDDGYLESITAFDAATGNQKWSRTFQDQNGVYTTASSLLYATNGDVYFVGTFSDRTQHLYALSSDGKELWSRSIPLGSKVYLLGDESLLISSLQEPHRSGKIQTNVTRLDHSGKLLSSQLLNGSLLAAQGQRIVMDTNRQIRINAHSWMPSSSPTIEVYTSDLKRLYTYKFPASVHLLSDSLGPTILVQNDGTLLLRGSIAGTVNKLFAFSPEGQLLWGRVIPADSVIFATNDGYVTYSNRKLTAFKLDGKVAERILDDSPGQFVMLERSDNGELQVDMAETLYILDPENLEIVRAVSNRALRNDYAFAYAGNVLYAAESGALVKYALSE